MPIIASAKKRVKQSEKKRKLRLPYKSRMLTLYKKILTLVEHHQESEASQYISEAYSAIDTACKKGIIKKNKASRMKSTLAKKVGSTPAKQTETPTKEEK